LDDAGDTDRHPASAHLAGRHLAISPNHDVTITGPVIARAIPANQTQHVSRAGLP
jgi:hypothetical protein